MQLENSIYQPSPDNAYVMNKVFNQNQSFELQFIMNKVKMNQNFKTTPREFKFLFTFAKGFQRIFLIEEQMNKQNIRLFYNKISEFAQIKKSKNKQIKRKIKENYLQAPLMLNQINTKQTHKMHLKYLIIILEKKIKWNAFRRIKNNDRILTLIGIQNRQLKIQVFSKLKLAIKLKKIICLFEILQQVHQQKQCFKLLKDILKNDEQNLINNSHYKKSKLKNLILNLKKLQLIHSFKDLKCQYQKNKRICDLQRNIQKQINEVQKLAWNIIKNNLYIQTQFKSQQKIDNNYSNQMNLTQVQQVQNLQQFSTQNLIIIEKKEQKQQLSNQQLEEKQLNISQSISNLQYQNIPQAILLKEKGINFQLLIIKIEVDQQNQSQTEKNRRSFSSLQNGEEYIIERNLLFLYNKEIQFLSKQQRNYQHERKRKKRALSSISIQTFTQQQENQNQQYYQQQFTPKNQEGNQNKFNQEMSSQKTKQQNKLNNLFQQKQPSQKVTIILENLQKKRIEGSLYKAVHPEYTSYQQQRRNKLLEVEKKEIFKMKQYTKGIFSSIHRPSMPQRLNKNFNFSKIVLQAQEQNLKEQKLSQNKWVNLSGLFIGYLLGLYLIKMLLIYNI